MPVIWTSSKEFGSQLLKVAQHSQSSLQKTKKMVVNSDGVVGGPTMNVEKDPYKSLFVKAEADPMQSLKPEIEEVWQQADNGEEDAYSNEQSAVNPGTLKSRANRNIEPLRQKRKPGDSSKNIPVELTANDDNYELLNPPEDRIVPKEMRDSILEGELHSAWSK